MKITVFETLVVSKIINLASVTVSLNSTVTQLHKIDKEFIIGIIKDKKSKKKIKRCRHSV